MFTSLNSTEASWSISIRKTPDQVALSSPYELILNGDVYLKMTGDPNEHRGCIAFITKDDNQDNPKGAWNSTPTTRRRAR